MVGSILTIIDYIEIIIAGRFFLGISVGFITTIIPGFINDISPTHLRGVLGYSNAILLYSGIIFAFTMGLGVPLEDVQKQATTEYW